MLTRLLRAIGLLDLLAFVAVVMPRFLMAAVHEQLHLGTLPTDPIVGYLARTASLFYGFSGVLLLYLSNDVIRYREVIRFLSLCGIIAGGLVLMIDWIEGLPRWWILLEGPGCAILAALVWWQSRIR